MERLSARWICGLVRQKKVASREERVSALNATLAAGRWVFVAVCGSAGALAVPIHPAGTPASALAAGIAGLAGLRVWRWSRLPSATKNAGAEGIERLVQPVLCLGAGFVVGLLLVGVMRLAIQPLLPAIANRMAAAAALPVWRRALIIFVSAVGEEVIFRLILLSLIAGVAARLFRPAMGIPNRERPRRDCVRQRPPPCLEQCGAVAPRPGSSGAGAQRHGRHRLRTFLHHPRHRSRRLGSRGSGLRDAVDRPAHRLRSTDPTTLRRTTTAGMRAKSEAPRSCSSAGYERPPGEGGMLWSGTTAGGCAAVLAG